MYILKKNNVILSKNIADFFVLKKKKIRNI